MADAIDLTIGLAAEAAGGTVGAMSTRHSFTLAANDPLLKKLGVHPPDEATIVECELCWVPFWTTNADSSRDARSEEDQLVMEEKTAGEPRGLEFTLSAGTWREDWVLPVQVVQQHLKEDAILDFIQLPAAAYGDKCFWHRARGVKRNEVVDSEVACDYCHRKMFRMLRENEVCGMVPKEAWRQAEAT